MTNSFRAALALLAGCGSGFADSSPPDGGSDAPPGCVVGISHEVQPPFASPGTVVRAAANVQNSPGQHTYTWFLSVNGGPNQTPTPASLDGSQVEFPATTNGAYRVRFRIEDPNCEEASETIEVDDPGASISVLRVHAVAPPELERPPITKLVTIESGQNDLIEDIQLPEGITTTGTLTSQGISIPAYLKFIPAVGSDAVVETYANQAGGYSATVRSESHTVLVVPLDPTLSAQRLAWSPGQTQLELPPGVLVAGSVLDPQGSPLAGVRVQVSVDGVPSAAASTDGSGGFVLRAPAAVGNVRFEVMPVEGAGLPRLVAEGAQFDVTDPLTIRYAAGLATTRDLAGTTVQRAGALANTPVTIVGTLASAGTVTGATTLTATGEVRFATATNGSGALPTLRVPAAPLHAVVFPGTAGDHAVTAIDLTTAVPASITAPAMVSRATQLTSSTGTGLTGAVLDAIPTGPLALAGAPSIRRTAGAAGNLTIQLAPNATYAIRLSDPNGNGARGALVRLDDQTTATLPATLALAKSTRVQASVLGTSAIPGAIVQFLCADVACTGIERSRPIAEGITGIDGRFSLGVPDSN